MAGAGDIRAGKATVELFADNNPLSRGLKAADASLKSWGKSVNKVGKGLAALGSASMAADMAKLTAAFGAAVEFGNVGAELQHMSDRTGIAVESLSLLKFAAEQGGIGLEDLETGVKKMQKAIAAGSPAIAKLGLSAAALRNMAPEAALGKIADRLAAIENPTKRAALAMAIFGKSGTALLPMFSQGADGLRALTEAGKAAGLGWSGAEARAALNFKNALGLLYSQLKRIVEVVGSAVAPSLTEMMAKTTPILKSVIDWIKANKGLVWSMLQSAAAGVAFGAALTGLGFAVIGLGAAITALGTICATVGTIVGIVWAAITSPVFLIIAALAALTAAVVYVFATMSEEGQAASDTLSGTWSDMLSAGTEAWGGIVDALKTGDLALAGKIAMAGLYVVFQEGLIGIQTIWIEFKYWVLGLFDAMVNSAAGTMAGLLGMGDTFKQMVAEEERARKAKKDAEISAIDRTGLAAGLSNLSDLRATAADQAEKADNAARSVGPVARRATGGVDLDNIAKTSGTFNAYGASALGGISEARRQSDLLTEISKGIADLVEQGDADDDDVVS